MKTKEKLSSMKSVRFDGIYTGKEAEVGHGGGGGVHIYIYIRLHREVFWCVVHWHSEISLHSLRYRTL